MCKPVIALIQDTTPFSFFSAFSPKTPYLMNPPAETLPKVPFGTQSYSKFQHLLFWGAKTADVQFGQKS